MKKVKITVTTPEGKSTIEVNFEGETMPKSLDSFIVEHIGGRPDDRS